MKSLQDLDIFVRTADSGSLSATARALDLTPAAASAALKRLEAELGVTLFVRSTRSLRLTQEGELFLEHCRPALAGLRQVRDQLAGGQAALRGTLQLAAPSDLGRNVLMPWLDEFQSQHAGVDLRLHLSDRAANVYSEPVDAAFRYGRPQDSSLVALPLSDTHRRVLCAAPSYLQERGAPATPTTWPAMTACASCWARKCTTAGASGRQGRGLPYQSPSMCGCAAAMWPMTEMPCGAGLWLGGGLPTSRISTWPRTWPGAAFLRCAPTGRPSACRCSLSPPAAGSSRRWCVRCGILWR